MLLDDVVETLVGELPESAELGQLGDALADEVSEACGQAALLEHHRQLVEGAHVAHVRAYLARVDVLKKEPKGVHVDVERRLVLGLNRTYFNRTIVWIIIDETPFVVIYKIFYRLLCVSQVKCRLSYLNAGERAASICL